MDLKAKDCRPTRRISPRPLSPVTLPHRLLNPSTLTSSHVSLANPGQLSYTGCGARAEPQLCGLGPSLPCWENGGWLTCPHPPVSPDYGQEKSWCPLQAGAQASEE